MDREPLLPQSRLGGARLVSLGLVFLAGTLLFGCGNSEYVPPLAPVKGKVTVDGAPLTSGQVSLVPVVPPSQPVPPSMGKVGTDGTYEIFTSGKSGAPLGKYKVWISPPTIPTEGGGPPDAPPYNSKYRDQKKTPLEIDVVAKADPGKYDLVLSK